MMRRYLPVLTVLTTLLALTTPAFTQTVLFGPKQYTRTAGPPNQFTDTFTLPSGTTPPYTLHVVNGNANGTNRISSATVTLNGAQILGPSDFGQNVAVIDRTITPQASNTLEIRLTSAPGSFITLTVLDTSAGSQPTALTPNPLNLNAGATGALTATLAPAPTAAGSLTVSSANPAVATVSASVSFTSGQTSVPVTVTAVASGSTTITVALNGGSAASQVTVTPPLPTITGFTPSSGQPDTQVTLTGTNFVNVQTVTFNGVLAPTFTVTDATTLVVVVPPSATTGPIAVMTLAGTATSATNFTVNLPPPTITGFTPTSGTVGTVVTITGTNFGTIAQGGTIVRFNGKAAVATSVTATSLTTTVPQGAPTGLITVTTPGGTAISAQTFTVTTSQDFSLTVAPVALSVVQGRPITTQVQLANTGSNPVTGFVALAATGLPTGMTGAFTPAQIAGGQTATLTLNSGTAPAGPVTITVTATTVVDGQTIVRQSPLTITVLAAGGTTLAGRILATKDDAPIPGALVKIGSLIVTTDASGNFLFTNAPAGSQVLLIDGPSALYPSDLPVPVTLAPTVANTLSYPVYLHEVSQNYFPLVPGQATVIQPPDIPDFTMLIPAGTTIMGWDNQPNTRVSVTRVPIDRLPLPPIPPTVSPTWVYMFNFGKPGGGYPSRPIPIIFPNDTGALPGSRVDLWYYDESPTPDPNSNQWKMYGQGTVTEDGLRIVPDPGVGQPKFCCGGGFPAPARDAKGPGTDILSGDPVSLSTGLFHVEMTDLVLPGRLPVVIRRGYRSQVVPPVFPLPRQFPRTLVNLEEFGINTALLDYDDRLTVSGSTATAITGFERSLLTRNTDGTFTNSRFPFMQGTVVRLNPDGSSTLRDKTGTVRTFGADGWLRSITDRNGNTITVVRNGREIHQILEPGGRALTFTYSGERITQITDPIGRTVQYGYEVNPAPNRPFTRLTTVTNPANGVTHYDYNTEDCISGITDARGIRYLTNEYLPLATEWTVSRQTQADGGVWQFHYVLNGLIVTQATVTDPRGNPSVHRFNGLSYEVAMVDARGQQRRTTRDFVSNQVMEVRDSLNRLTKFTYDLAGNVNSILNPQQNPTLFEYEPTFNRVTKTTDALNQITRSTYDPVTGNLLTTTDPLLHATAIAYNQFGQPISVTDALNHTTTFEYDEVGNLIATVDPLGNRTLRFYDAVSRLIALVDPRGKGTKFTYDALNRVTQIQDAINGVTTFTYDPNGNLLTVTDAKNQVTTYTYGNMDRLATRKDALNRTESYQYDLAGNLIQFTDRKNQVTTFQYDALNRRTSATYADATTTSTYDTVGRLMKASDTAPGAGSIEFGYDILNRLIQETTGQGTVAYQYDVLGRRTQMTANAQQPVAYGYDSASRLTQVAQGNLAVGLGYDNANRRTLLTYPNNTSTGYIYDVASRLTNINHIGPSGIIEALTYQYDLAGNRTGLTRNNGTASLLPAAVAAATYDAANEQTTFAGAALTYDNNGNLISDGANTYVWDARNRLVSMNGGATASFSYDALGRRVNKTVNGQSTQFFYDGNDILAEIGGGTVGANYLRSLNIDEPFIRQTSAGNEYYHTDTLGSSLALSNAAGASVATYGYEPFGKTTSTGSSSNALQYTGRENDGMGLYYYRARYLRPSYDRFISEDPILAPMNPFAIGLCRLTNDTVWLLPARLLQPAVGNGWKLLNGYAYASNNPLRFVDPTGLEPNKRDEACKSAADDCTKAFKELDFVRPDGTTVSACYSAGMSSATAYGRGNYQANHASLAASCTDGTPYSTGRDTGGYKFPFPSACQNKTFQDKCQ